MDDSTLLHRYVTAHSDSAFAELVRRHVNLVYHSALRHVHGDPHQAEEIAQAVFTLLARKAPSLLRHPTLTGWLYTSVAFAAAESIRGEVRRQRREQTAHALTVQNDAPSAAWDKVRPVIDDALQELSPLDREALLLRFFEDRKFADIGIALRLTENAARMRVDRALERLRSALAHRGITSTGVALASALAVPGSLAAPAHLAPQLTAGALTGVATAAAGTGLWTILSCMNAAKIVALSTSALALLATGVAWHQHREVLITRAERTALQRKLQSQVDNLEWRLAAAYERTAKADASAESAATRAGGSTVANATAAPAQPVTRDQVESRLQRARELASAGRHAEALAEYLWCYDTGTRQVEGYFLARYSEVLDAVAAIGQHYPEAFNALKARRDAAKTRLMASPTDMEAGKDFGSLNRVLGEMDQTFALFDALPEDDPRRGHLVDTNIGRLMEAQRYRELAKAMPYTTLPQVWEQMAQIARSPVNEAARATIQRHAVNFAAMQVELRAGAGDFVDASDMIERLLVFDSSPETVAAIKLHLDRAGHPELFRDP